MAVLDAQKGSHERALIIAGVAATLRQKLGVPNPIIDRAELSESLETSRRSLERSRAEESERRGALMNLAEAIRFAESGQA